MQSLRTTLTSFDAFENFLERSKWMRRKDVVTSIAQLFDREESFARVFLSLMLLHKEKDAMLDENDAMDRILGRLAASLHAKVADEAADMNQIRAQTERAKIMFDAWKVRDKEQVVEFLQTQCIATPPTQTNADLGRETMLRWIEDIAGPEVRSSTEARCDRRWARVRADDLPAFIQETAERAYWDVLRERVEAGDIEGTLFPLLRDLRGGIEALLAAAPRTRAQFQERFDVDWLLERHRNGSLSRQDVGNYAVYIAEMVQQLQAPADAAEVGAWVEDVRRMANTASITMQEYIPYLVSFARDAAVHMRKVVQRLEELSQQRQRRAEHK